MKSVGVLGIGSYEPEKVLANSDLEKIMDTSDEWIQAMTGIKERRIAEGMDTSDMGALAAQAALENAGLSPSDIDLILVATCTAEQAFPSSACMVQEKIGARGVPAFDIAAACSGFVYAMVTAKQFIETGVYKRVLVVGSEKLSKIIDWSDRSTAVLFGDGAGAVVMGEVSEGKGILSFEIGADGTGGKHLCGKDRIFMNGREVFKFAVRQMPDSSLSVVEKAGLRKEDVDFLVPHQANIRIIDAARERLGLPEDKVSATVRFHGNTSAASIPLALCREIGAGKIKDGDVLVLVGFGGGLTWGAICMKWGK